MAETNKETPKVETAEKKKLGTKAKGILAGIGAVLFGAALGTGGTVLVMKGREMKAAKASPNKE